MVRYVLYALLFLFVGMTGPVIEPDTGSYYHLDIITTPGYPAFLYGFKKIFSAHYGWYVIFIQLLIVLVSSHYVIKTFQKYFQSSHIILFFMEVLFLLPIVLPEYLVVNRIVSEALAYPIFLMIMSLLLDGLLANNTKYLWRCFIAVGIGILVRPQFNFILPVILIIFGYEWFRTKNLKRFGSLIVSLVLLPFVILILNKSYHYLVQGYFTNTANTGVLIMTLPMYVADANDYKVYEDPRQQAYFNYVYAEAKKTKVLEDYAKPKYNENGYRHFHDIYAELSFGVLSGKGRAFLYPEAPGTSKAVIGNNAFLIDMYWPLLVDNFSKVMTLFYHNFLHAFHGWYMIILHLLIVVIAFYYWIKERSALSLISLFLLLSVFSNTILVCSMLHSIDRYFMYHQWALPVLLLLAMNPFNARINTIPQKNNS